MLRTSDRESGRNELLNRKELYEAQLKAWQSVTVRIKKDGTDFKSIGKAIQGARYEPYLYGPKGVYILTVNFQTLSQGYCSDTLYCYKVLEKDEITLVRHKENIIRESPFKPFYKYDLDDIRLALRERIENLGKLVDEVDNELKHYDLSFDRISEAVDNLQKTLDSETQNHDEIDLFYVLKHAINDAIY